MRFIMLGRRQVAGSSGLQCDKSKRSLGSNKLSNGRSNNYELWLREALPPTTQLIATVAVTCGSCLVLG